MRNVFFCDSSFFFLKKASSEKSFLNLSGYLKHSAIHCLMKSTQSNPIQALLSPFPIYSATLVDTGHRPERSGDPQQRSMSYVVEDQRMEPIGDPFQRNRPSMFHDPGTRPPPGFPTDFFTDFGFFFFEIHFSIGEGGPRATSSAAESEAESGEFRAVTRITASRIPALCVVTPPPSDDESLRCASASANLLESHIQVRPPVFLFIARLCGTANSDYLPLPRINEENYSTLLQ